MTSPIVLPYTSIHPVFIHSFTPPLLPHRAALIASDQDPFSYPLVTRVVPSPVTVAVREGCLHLPLRSSPWRWHCSPPPPSTIPHTGGEGGMGGMGGKGKGRMEGLRREEERVAEWSNYTCSYLLSKYTNHGTRVSHAWHHDIWGT